MLAAVVQLAEHVGDVLVDLQSTDGLAPRAKSDGSPLTFADERAHAILAHGLPDIGPYLVVSEESGPHENSERRNCERVWIVDPLDGTRGYIQGSDEFTVNVALIENGSPILGVIVAPRLGVTYLAELGQGAFRLRPGSPRERIFCDPRPDADARIVVSGSDAHLGWGSIPRFAGVRVEAFSSSVKLGFVADGSAIAYPRLTPSSEWDIAAGHAILLEAGGRVVGINGRDLTYNKEQPLNTAFVATGCAALAAAFQWPVGPGL